MQNKVKILAVGDIIGKGARNAFINYLPTLKAKYNYDIIAVNAENTTHGNGLSYKHYQLYKNSNIDILTMGNHVLGNKEINDYIYKTDNLIVPANVKYENDLFESYKEKTICFNGVNIKFVNLLGKCNKNEKYDKYETLDFIKYFEEKYKNDDSIFVVDFHAEYTLEKNLFGYYFDGKVSAVYGTHTHVQTSDERILPNGTGFISDVGMCGSKDSIIGYDYMSYLDRIEKGTMTKVSEIKPFMINAILFEIDLESKKTTSITRINELMQ